MFLKPLEAQSRGETLEMIIEKRMQNMVHFENKIIIFVDKIHFEKSQKNEELNNWKIKNTTICFFKDRFKSNSDTAKR